jgi:hypothetical protein
VNWLGYAPIDILTAILVIITAIYAGLTYSIARSSRAMVDHVNKQIESQIRPAITVNIGIRAKVAFFLKITNRGNSAAERLRLSIDRSFYRFADKLDENNIAQLHLFRDVVQLLHQATRLKQTSRRDLT